MSQKISRLIALAVLLSGTCAAQAQDKIYLNNGTQIDGKVKEINSRNIVYKSHDAPEGPDYVLTRKEVSRIKYENGVEETMVASSAPMRGPHPGESSNNNYRKQQNRHPVTPYGKTILAFAPIQMTNESPAGVGLSLEHFLDKDNIFSLYLPFAFAFYQDGGDYNTQAPQKNRVYSYLYPGMKIYPGGSNRRVSYSVGPSFALGFGSKYFTRTIYDPQTGYPTGTQYYEDDDFKAGFLVNNGLNIQPTQALYIGLEFGLGIMYYASNSNAFDEPLVQFQFKMGYRF